MPLKPERDDSNDFVVVVDEHRSTGVTEARAAPAPDRTRVVQRVQVAAPGDVAVDFDDARGRLVTRLDVHRMRLNRLDAVPHVLDECSVTVSGGAAQRPGGAQRCEFAVADRFTVRSDRAGVSCDGLGQFDDADVIVRREAREVVVGRVWNGGGLVVVRVRVQPGAASFVQSVLGVVVGARRPAGQHIGLVECDPDVVASALGSEPYK